MKILKKSDLVKSIYKFYQKYKYYNICKKVLHLLFISKYFETCPNYESVQYMCKFNREEQGVKTEMNKNKFVVPVIIFYYSSVF